MSSRSSIFSFEAVPERVRPTKAFVLALVLVIGVRVALGLAGDAMVAIPGETADGRFFGVEGRIRVLDLQPRVILMGSSFAHYALYGPAFADAAGMPQGIASLRG